MDRLAHVKIGNVNRDQGRHVLGKTVHTNRVEQHVEDAAGLNALAFADGLDGNLQLEWASFVGMIEVDVKRLIRNGIVVDVLKEDVDFPCSLAFDG